MKLEFRKISRYVIFGLIFNIIAYALYSILTFTDKFGSESQRLVVSALILFPVMFLVNRKYVFASNNMLIEDFIRFTVIYLAAIIYGLVGLTISLIYISNPYLAQAVSSMLVLTSTFALNNYWSFRQQQREVSNSVS